MYIYEKSKNENEIKESAYAYQDEQNGISFITTNSIAIPDILLIVIKQKWTWQNYIAICCTFNMNIHYHQVAISQRFYFVNYLAANQLNKPDIK